MKHDGAHLDRHLQAFHDHALAQRAAHHQLAQDAHADLEAERAAQENEDGAAAPSPQAPA